MTVTSCLVREFALQGPGDFAKLEAQLPFVASAFQFGQSTQVSYPIAFGSEELVDSILKAVEESGFKAVKTRARVERFSSLSSRYWLILPEDTWRDFAEYDRFRKSMSASGMRASCAVPGKVDAVEYTARFLPE